MVPEIRLEETNPESNIQVYTPAALLKKGQVEMQLFNNLYTQTANFNSSGEKINSNSRATYFSGLFYVLYGISSSARVNVGMDVNFKSVRLDQAGSSPFNVLRFEKSGMTRTAISSIGPKVKFAPFKSIPRLSVQSTFWIPVIDDPEGSVIGRPFLDWNRYTSWTQLFYDKAIGTKFQLFSGVDLLWRIPRNKGDKHLIATPASLFLSYFPTSKSTVYVSSQIWPEWSNGAYFLQSGLGGKYQITTHLNIELLYTHFVAGLNQGAGKTFNLGLRYLR